MFLEETIGSLDAEADSGVSTDDTDQVEPSKLPRTWPKRDAVPRGKPDTALQPCPRRDFHAGLRSHGRRGRSTAPVLLTW